SCDGRIHPAGPLRVSEVVHIEALVLVVGHRSLRPSSSPPHFSSPVIGRSRDLPGPGIIQRRLIDGGHVEPVATRRMCGEPPDHALSAHCSVRRA
ncbi:MAG: hypothetical protein ACRDSH_17700, partial [Pseudonocardiaceae bacterium]